MVQRLDCDQPNPHDCGLHSFDQKLIIIAGGYDKKSRLPAGTGYGRQGETLILMGVTANKIEQTVRSAPGFAESGMQILHVSGMEEAVQTARDVAQPGDIVSLSPACASFDLYRNFELRGQHYKALVNALDLSRMALSGAREKGYNSYNGRREYILT
ncbi:MAG: hypothetical protein ACLSAP_04070 [Oscillospiraceae bacterium]